MGLLCDLLECSMEKGRSARRSHMEQGYHETQWDILTEYEVYS